MKVGIIGVGLIGGSIAKALGRDGVSLYLDDADPEVRQMLEEMAIGRVKPHADWIGEVDKVVIGAPLASVAKLIDTVSPGMKAEAALVELSSLKGPIREALVRAARSVRVLSLHLMAGREVSGLDAAKADLFEGCQAAGIDLGAGPVDATEARWWQRHLNFGEFRIWSLEDHDAAVAWVSHLPYIVSRSLRETVAASNPTALELAGPGYRDTSRVGLSPWDPLAPLFYANADEIDRALTTFEEMIHQWRDILKPGRHPSEEGGR